MNKTFLSSIMSDLSVNEDFLNTDNFKESLLKKFDYELVDLFNDTNNPPEYREILIEEFNRRGDPLMLTECISNLNSRYIDSPICQFGVKKILLEICNNKSISFPLRIMAAQSFEIPKEKTTQKENNSLLINIYTNILQQVNKENIDYWTNYQVSTTFFWDIFKKILEFPQENQDDILERLDTLLSIAKTIFNNSKLDEEFRYKLLQSISKSHKVNDDIKSTLFKEFLNIPNLSDYKYYIYVCQMLKNIEYLFGEDLDILYSLTKTRQLTNNAIADIADFLLSTHYDTYIILGKELLNKVSFDGKSIKTIYNNAQNIHHIDVDSSINPFIEKLIDMNFDVQIPNPEDTDNYSNFLQKFIENIQNHTIELKFDEEEKSRVKNSLTRFVLDNTLYSNYNISLLQLLIKAYYYIQIHPFKNDLIRRMCDELVDMSDTCTTGHIYRLVNIFSGYDVEMKMPVEEELKSCVFARLQKIILLKSDEEQDAIYEVIGSSKDIKEREKKKIETVTELSLDEEYIDKELLMKKEEDPEIEFNKLLGKDIHNLYEELRSEYVGQGIIEEQTYITYIRKAISAFQVGEKI